MTDTCSYCGKPVVSDPRLSAWTLTNDHLCAECSQPKNYSNEENK